jgi:hypothetical protein
VLNFKNWSKRKKIRITFFIGLFIFPFYAISQKIYTVDYPSQADLKVFKVDYQSLSKENEGLWCFVKYPSQSDLKIFFVKYKSQSGWRNNSKKHLLY